MGAVVVLLEWLAAGGFDTTINGGDVVARRMWVVVGQSVEFGETSLRWWLLVEEATSQLLSAKFVVSAFLRLQMVCRVRFFKTTNVL